MNQLIFKYFLAIAFIFISSAYSLLNFDKFKFSVRRWAKFIFIEEGYFPLRVTCFNDKEDSHILSRVYLDPLIQSQGKYIFWQKGGGEIDYCNVNRFRFQMNRCDVKGRLLRCVETDQAIIYFWFSQEEQYHLMISYSKNHTLWRIKN